jgi:hypothetical protein
MGSGRLIIDDEFVDLWKLLSVLRYSPGIRLGSLRKNNETLQEEIPSHGSTWLSQMYTASVATDWVSQNLNSLSNYSVK